MKKFNLPYGRGTLEAEIPEDRISGELVSKIQYYQPELSQEDLVRRSLDNPIGSPKLWQIAENKDKVVIIASDHTRPVPSKIITPILLEYIRRGNPNADITILISTVTHRETSHEELVDKFGEKIVREEKIVVHNGEDQSQLVRIGYLPSGGPLVVNKLAVEADLLIGEGFIEPHFFAGYSGGRKSVFPGITSCSAVRSNHNGEFIADKNSRTGIIDDNPIHRDMLYGARATGLDFICNVVINAKKEIIYSVAGDCDLAHREGIGFLNDLCKVEPVLSDIVISTNGGYPLDQNIYQSVKGMTAAEATVKDGGIIIMLAKSEDGHGGDELYRSFKEEKDLERMLEKFISTPHEETIQDQWQSQILARILTKARVIYVSQAPFDVVENFQMIPARTVDEALEKADKIRGDKKGSIAIIPDGVSVIVG